MAAVAFCKSRLSEIQDVGTLCAGKRVVQAKDGGSQQEGGGGIAARPGVKAPVSRGQQQWRRHAPG